MSTTFTKLSLWDFIRRRVCSVPFDAADGLVIPKCLKNAPSLSPAAEELVWYFAYGSNLCDSTFLKRRKQQPLKTIQATAPGYILRFDLPGIPYQEPAFSSIRRRIGEEDPDVIGIAYLLTRDEYERLLLSEGGRDGGYMEIDVSVKPLLDLTDEKSSIMCKSLGTREPRENPHPQPSARYISLIQTGAAEHKFPAKYRKYLESLPIYRISSLKTEIGRILFLLMWLPLVVFIFTATGRYKNGNVPKWLKKLQRWVFTTMWIVHDRFFARIFGRGDVASAEKPPLRYAIVE